MKLVPISVHLVMSDKTLSMRAASDEGLCLKPYRPRLSPNTGILATTPRLSLIAMHRDCRYVEPDVWCSNANADNGYEDLTCFTVWSLNHAQSLLSSWTATVE